MNTTYTPAVGHLVYINAGTRKGLLGGVVVKVARKYATVMHSNVEFKVEVEYLEPLDMIYTRFSSDVEVPFAEVRWGTLPGGERANYMVDLRGVKVFARQRPKAVAA